jgi:pimeloyl-ACP methyl ester carboxylesterase
MTIALIRPNFWKLAALCLLMSSLAQFGRTNGTAPLTPKPPLSRTVNVPFDYNRPELGSFTLYYELGRPFDPLKPTVFVIADGQQFYVRKGSVADLQVQVFGDQLNVVGIVGRGFNDAVIQKYDRDGRVDWPSAYEFLKSDQWVEDIERVRTHFLGPTGHIDLYGRSGGGLLVHKYIARHPSHVNIAFTQAAVNRFLDAEFGLQSDHFWTDLGNSDPSLQPLLLEVIEKHRDQYDKIMLLLQRQNFFVSRDKITPERARLIHGLARWDQDLLDGLAREYQIQPIIDLLNSPQGAAARVRVFELFSPVLPPQAPKELQRIDPDDKVGRIFGAPLFTLLAQGKINTPVMYMSALHDFQGQAYVVAGRYDHTADYRSQIALATCFRNHRLLLLKDSHDFPNLYATGHYARLVQAIFAHGLHSPQLAAVERRLEPLIYHEN